MAITSARMQMRRGLEADFDPDKMQPGEWAVSLDKKYVRMCFSVGVCVRMATYDAFEKDMEQIGEILSTCETIEEAVSKINTEVSANAKAVAEYTEQAKQYRDEAKQFRDEAEQFAPDGYIELKETVASNTAKIDTIIEKAELNIKNTAKGKNLHLTDSANGKNVGFGLYGKATQDGEPTPDNPIEITVAGESYNLLENTAESQTIANVTFTVNDDGSVTANGTATNTIYFKVKTFVPIIGENYILSGCPSGGSTTTYRLYWNTNNKTVSDVGAGAMTDIITNNTTSNNDVIIFVYNGTTLNNVTFYPMIRKASVKNDRYMPYGKGSVEVVTENEDSAQSTTAIIPTPNGLCGIKVSSGGNYTDENGQQWICDEVVKYADGSGKRIQRVGKAVFDENYVVSRESVVDGKGGRIQLTNLNDAVYDNNRKIPLLLCSHYEAVSAGNVYNRIQGICINSMKQIYVWDDRYTEGIDEYKAWIKDNPITLYYVLAEPIITDLSAEEIAEIEKLHTFYPVTNISNDADCGMSITYMADAKNYIDNRLALIESAMLNNI